MAKHQVQIEDGDRHNMLVAVALSHKTSNGQYWTFACDCGKSKVIRAADVVGHKQKSCGCLSVTHGNTRGGKSSPTHMSWVAMRERCTNPKMMAYANYGGRGITICSQWANDFTQFLADMGERPSKDHSIDRIDTNGNYEPSNCRWATSTEQNQNRRNMVMVTVGDETLCVAEWSRRFGVPHDTIWRRMNVMNWSAEKAVTTPVGADRRKRPATLMLTVDGETKSLVAWSSSSGIPEHTLRARVKYGWYHKRIVTTPNVVRSRK